MGTRSKVKMNDRCTKRVPVRPHQIDFMLEVETDTARNPNPHRRRFSHRDRVAANSLWRQLFKQLRRRLRAGEDLSPSEGRLFAYARLKQGGG